MTQIRFGRLIVLACMGLAVACTSGTDGGTAGNTELNLDIVNPGGTSGELGFSIDRVDYRITCAGNPPGSYPIPDADTSGTDYNYDDSVDISGAFETVDTRVPPVWQAVMDLPPGDCTITLSVWDGDEIVCVGSQTLVIIEDGTTKYDIVLVCSLSVDLPDGMADVDGTFEFITGNLCPKLYVLNAIPSGQNPPGFAIPVRTNPLDPYFGQAVTEVQYRAKDPDNTCGSNCDPQSCTFDNPPVCTPAPYNPNDPLCNPAVPGGDPNSAACLANGAGLVCTIAAIPSSTPGVPGGTFISPNDLTTPVGPVLPVNLNTASGIPGLILPGLGGPVTTSSEPTGGAPGDNPLYPALPNANGSLPPLYYSCDLALPGAVVINLDCSDGDAECDQNKQMILVCPGENFCVSQPVDCSGANECLTDGVCDAFCDPADLGGPGCPAGTRCPGQNDPQPQDTACTVGGNVCDGLGNCVECTGSTAGICDAVFPPQDCQLPNTCVGFACQQGGIAPAGTPCSNGQCNGAGYGLANCIFVACNPCEEDCGQTGGPDFDPNTCNQTVTLGCTNNITPDISILPWQMEANPGIILSGAAFAVAYTGTAVFSETFLDAGLAAVPGLSIAELVDAVASAHVRAGAAGADVPIFAEPIPTTCGGGANQGLPCTPGNEAVDCPPGLPFVSCSQFVAIPTIDGTGDACAACNALGPPKDAQCAANGYCIAPGGLDIPLENTVGNYTADASGVVRIGFDDASTGATTNPDGTYALPAASFPASPLPNGVRVIASVLQVALQCTMAVDSGGPDGTVPPVPDQSSPTPDSLLTTFNIQVP